ncbi:sensor histidine kinase [Nocardia bovistercoris]|uniref:Histidine kinase dimerization/phosphoacceptor domain-containing protein n=1 Tax=Nocardia bovistercoris TaxID=2785916 RepID=A0A931IAE1_9NOCA|nr:histidine kinase dimerization/phosphoacceptor domain-containing protein [Nocardia bovistercoris]MBH0777927.1 histidine kinase dimerization/phosphoacceptor domain-containing protein [Nocardia bovistercoris]
MVTVTLERALAPSTARPEQVGAEPTALRRLSTRMSRDIVDVAAAGTVVAALALALLTLLATVTGGADPRADLGATVVMLSVCLPIYLRHIAFAVRGAIPHGAAATSAVLAALVLGAAPLLGVAWLHTVHIVAVAVVLTVRPALAWPITLVLVAATAPAALLLGATEQQALWMSVTTGMRVIAVYALVWMVVALRRLLRSGATLTEWAIARERLRIDRELASTVQAALAEISAFAQRAEEFTARGDRASARRELEALADVSRHGLAEARQLIRGFQQPVFHREIASALALLTAAGIEARADLPPAGLPARGAESLRTALRAELARLLRDGADGPVVLAVERVDGAWVLECHLDTLAPSAGGRP